MYIGVRLFKSNSKTNKNKKVKNNQAILEGTASNSLEKEHDHYLQISTASMGLAAIEKILPPFHLFSLGMIAYTSLPILRQVEKAFKEKKKLDIICFFRL
ncbi:hypothetical protein BGP_3776 [Beggiatoa sp. PS]|nr:hypothetical protein BGP_3776 [Beggiatoa sp. PS]